MGETLWDEETWLEIFKTRYPNIDISVGKVSRIDNEGKPYITLVIGGQKRELEEFPLWFTSSWIDDGVLQLWWDTFDRYARGAKKIYIRRFPNKTVKQAQELDTFSFESPKLVDKTYIQMSGRFSFHY